MRHGLIFLSKNPILYKDSWVESEMVPMKNVWIRSVALLLALVIMFPAQAFAAEPEEQRTVNVDLAANSHVTAELSAGNMPISAGSRSLYELEVGSGYSLESVEVEIQSEDDSRTYSLTPDKVAASAYNARVSVYDWPENGVGYLRVENQAGPNDSGEITVRISFRTDALDAFRVSAEEVSGVSVAGSGEFAEGESVTVTVTPENGYQLTELGLNYGEDVETLTGSGSWQGWTVNWSGTGQTTITGTIYNDLEIRPVVEPLPDTYTLSVELDEGLNRDRPSSSRVTVTEGNTYQVRVSADAGYRVSDFTVRYGKRYASWAMGQTYLVMGNDRVEVDEDLEDREVSFTLPPIYDNTEITFTSTYDEDNIPVTIRERSHINIDASCGDTIERGTDAEFTISTTSDRYQVTEITLEIGDESGDADPEDGEIVVGNRTYEILDMGDGEYMLYVDNIREPVTVSARTYTGNNDGPRLTIGLSSHIRITKNVSGSYIDEGDDVTFYFTPDTNYQIDEITVRVGSSSRTVDADSGSIRVGGTSYRMSRSSSGRVTLYLTDITENVTVSGRASYDPQAELPEEPSSGVLQLNTSSRSVVMSGYPDGTFRPSDNMTRAEAVVMLFRVCSVGGGINTSDVYADVPAGAWYTDEVNVFANAGILDRGACFYPEQNISRGNLVEMLYRLSGSPAVTGSTAAFTDISFSPNRAAILYAVNQGWVNGYADGTFRPNSAIARDEVAALMTRVLNRTSGGSSISYLDVPASHWAYRYIQLASSTN